MRHAWRDVEDVLFAAMAVIVLAVLLSNVLYPPPASTPSYVELEERIPSEEEILDFLRRGRLSAGLWLLVLFLLFSISLFFGGLVLLFFFFRARWWRGAEGLARNVPFGLWAAAKPIILMIFLSIFFLSLPLPAVLFQGSGGIPTRTAVAIFSGLFSVAYAGALLKRSGAWSMIFGSESSFGKAIGTGLVMYVTFYPIYSGLTRLTHLLAGLFSIKLEPQEVLNLLLENRSIPALCAFGVLALVVAPLCEELLFRGLVYRSLKRILGFLPAMAVSAVLFSCLHMTFSTFLPIFGLGLVLAYAYERTGSLAAAIALHVLHNLVNLIAFLVLLNLAA